MKPIKTIVSLACVAVSLTAAALDHKNISHDTLSAERFALIADGKPALIVVDESENSAVRIAASSLAADFGRVCGENAEVSSSPTAGARVVVAGTYDGPTLKALSRARWWIFRN